MSSVVISQINLRGRIAVCGSISAHNAKETPQGKLRLLTDFVIAIPDINWKL